MMKLIIRHKKDIPAAVKKILKHCDGKKIFAFEGPVGSGKTTIIKAFCRALGAHDPATSPSFTIVNEYRRDQGKPLYHIDLYRILKPSEVYETGFGEYLDSGSFCFIEWPGIVEEMLPEETVRIKIIVGDDEERILTVP